jgi:hypothetical protein
MSATVEILDVVVVFVQQGTQRGIELRLLGVQGDALGLGDQVESVPSVLLRVEKLIVHDVGQIVVHILWVVDIDDDVLGLIHP